MQLAFCRLCRPSAGFVDVFISDMPLKLRRYGKSWASLFPREVALVTAHAQWAKFSVEVIVKDDLAKQRAQNNRDFKGNPVEARPDVAFASQLLEGRPAGEAELARTQHLTLAVVRAGAHKNTATGWGELC